MEGQIQSSSGNIILPDLPDASELDYHLPEDYIAKRPAEPRDLSNLLISDVSLPDSIQVHDSKFRYLPKFLPADSLLVLNQSRVITARLLMNKEGTGGRAEVLCITPTKPSVDPAVALNAKSGDAVWKCLIGGKNIRVGSRLVLSAPSSQASSDGEGVDLVASVEARDGKDGLVRFFWSKPSGGGASTLTFGETLERVGHMPLPPYMNRASDEADTRDYQTVYANAEGSVAAPTAGLHFTESLLREMKEGPGRIDPCYVTLHVGAGTFQPVSGQDISEHAMHWERISVPVKTLEQLIDASAKGRPIIPVGTTSVRTLESLYWWGCSLLGSSPQEKERRSVAELNLGQWEAYHLSSREGLIPRTSVQTSLETLRRRAQEEGVTAIGGETQLMVCPGYRFALCDALITNFHQPRSTLLLLVSALMGGLRPIHRIYRHALSSKYRFLSFGDSNLMIPHAQTLLPLRDRSKWSWPHHHHLTSKTDKWIKLTP